MELVVDLRVVKNVIRRLDDMARARRREILATRPLFMFMEQSPGPGRGRREKIGGWIRTRELNLGEALSARAAQEIALRNLKKHFHPQGLSHIFYNIPRLFLKRFLHIQFS